MIHANTLESRLAAIEAQHAVLLPEKVTAPKTREPRIAAIIAAVEIETGISGLAILGARRTGPIALARQLVMHLALEHSGHSSTTIGRALRRDHSTVLYGHSVIAQRATEDASLAERLRALRAALSIPSPEGDA